MDMIQIIIILLLILLLIGTFIFGYYFKKIKKLKSFVLIIVIGTLIHYFIFGKFEIICFLLLVIFTYWYYIKKIKKFKSFMLILIIITLIYYLNFDMLDTFFAKTSIKYNNLVVCSLIKDDDQRRNCYEEIAIKRLDLDICDKITGIDRNSCYANIAKEKKDQSICEKIIEVSHFAGQKSYCYSDSAKNTQECENVMAIPEIGDVDMKVYCYSRIAIENNDLTACEDMVNKNNIDKCYFDIVMKASALNKSGLEICNLIKNEEIKNKCYIEIALYNGISVCEKFEDQELRKDCYCEYSCRKCLDSCTEDCEERMNKKNIIWWDCEPPS